MKPSSFLSCLVFAASWFGLSILSGFAENRVIPVQPATGGKPGFTRLLSEQTGLDFTNLLSASRALTNTIVNNGSGIAAGDVDGDGLC